MDIRYVSISLGGTPLDEQETLESRGESSIAQNEVDSETAKGLTSTF